MRINRSHAASGQALVEFALCVLVFALVTLAVIQFAILNHFKLVMAHASREGARYAATRLIGVTNPIPADQLAGIKEYIKGRAGTMNPPLADSDITVQIVPAGDAGNNSLDGNAQVTITYNVGATLPLIAPLLPKHMTFTSNCAMRMEKM